MFYSSAEQANIANGLPEVLQNLRRPKNKLLTAKVLYVLEKFILH